MIFKFCIHFYNFKMKSTNILIVSLLISILYGNDVIFGQEIQKEAIHQLGESNRSGDEFEASEDEMEYEYLEFEQQQDRTCEEFNDNSSSTDNSNILFEIILPEVIRYMEVSKVKVAVHNRMNSSEPLDVNVSMPNDDDNSKFRFYNNKINLKNVLDLTKIVTVPRGKARSFSFYIQTTDVIKLNNVMNIKVKASVRSKNYECYLTKSVNIKLPAVKIYHKSENNFYLIQTRQQTLMPVTPFNPYDSAKIEDLRMSVKITGNCDKSDYTDFLVTITNKNDFSEVVRITDHNTDTLIEVLLPEYTTYAIASMKGTGFCSITVITENHIILENFNPKFNLNITTLKSDVNNEANVRVCADYDPKSDDLLSIQTLIKVIYDVEMPNGYVYKELIDECQKPEIKVRKYTFSSFNILTLFYIACRTKMEKVTSSNLF